MSQQLRRRLLSFADPTDASRSPKSELLASVELAYDSLGRWTSALESLRRQTPTVRGIASGGKARRAEAYHRSLIADYESRLLELEQTLLEVQSLVYEDDSRVLEALSSD